MSLSLHTHVSKNIYENMTAILEIYAVVKKKSIFQFNNSSVFFKKNSWIYFKISVY